MRRGLSAIKIAVALAACGLLLAACGKSPSPGAASGARARSI